MPLSTQNNTTYKNKKQTPMSSGIPTPDHSNQAAADLFLRPRGHRDRRHNDMRNEKQKFGFKPEEETTMFNT
jgi:hypothetical protein